MATISARQRSIWVWSAILIALLVFFFRALERRAITPVTVTLGGETMGSTWQVRLGDWPGALDDEALKEKLRREIDNRLAEINKSLSAWDSTSVLSAFNRAPAESLVVMDQDFQRVLEAALQWSRATGGAFDPTVGPLVRVWGFSPDGGGSTPGDAEVDEAKSRTGVEHLATGVIQEGEVALAKHREGMELDVNGIAPGYAADEIARLLRDRGARNYTVEIGGEVVAKGERPEGGPWHIGVEAPLEGLPRPEGAWLAVLGITDGAIATSGTYRNFVRRAEGDVSHIIDPRSGRPVSGNLVSVTVKAPDCTAADALATALMVLGPEEGMRLVENLGGVEAMFVLQDESGAFRQLTSPGMSALELKPAP